MRESFLPYSDGLYHLDEGTIIYRGDSDLDQSSIIPRAAIYYTIIDGSDPQQIASLENAYGIVHEYEVFRSVKLFAVDRISDKLYATFPRDIQSILNNQFGYKSGTFGYDATRKRDSVASKDKELVDYLCDNGYDGYAANDMVAIDEPLLYRELVLCKPHEIVKYVRQVTKPHVVDRLREKHEAIMKAKELKEKRRNKSKKNMTSPVGKNLFDSPKMDKAYKSTTPIKRKLFGGKTHKQRRSTKKSK